MDKLSEHPALAPATVSRWRNGAGHAFADQLAVETPIAFVYNCEPYAVMMASPDNLEDFAYGFSLSEGIIENAGEILVIDQTRKGPGVSLGIEIPPHRAAPLIERARNMAGRTGCGICGIAEMEQVMRDLPVLPRSATIHAAAIDKAVTALPLRQTNNRLSGAVHAAAHANADGEILLVREDVGRHNALDKLIGTIVREGRPPANGMVVITSRCSMEMVQKTIRLGCPILVAVSAPTSLAIQMAEDHGLTIAAFARGDGFNVYTHPERII
ncbi:MAG: formate dehydrogenase accessory sulfurtransferase FdhD [Alphaproteobacteria bacterium]|nr:formate dehydrogenase accessory sulfurtransferase FdhD [Alphaproteobacteria bacterium]